VIAALTGPMRRCQEAGALRPDAGPHDLRMVLAMLEGAIATVPADARPRTAVRAIAVLLDGLFMDSSRDPRVVGK
jgi:hypothetical protein